MSDLSETLDRIDMEYWLNREGYEYKVVHGKSGTQLNVKRCPACGNDNWKVYLNQDTGLGNCFHGDCEAKFTKWSFVKADLGSTVSNREIFEHIENVAMEQGWRPKVKKVAKTQSVGKLKIPKSIELPHEGKNLKYLAERGIDLDTVREFGLRFCAKGWFEFIGPTGEKQYQNYTKRILIPVKDLDGRLVSFQGRDITGTAEKKYLFPPGFASTGTYLYNGHNAYGYVDVVVGEGAFDVMAIYQAFKTDIALRNVGCIGSFGKHISEGFENSQMEELLKLKDAGMSKLTIMWDGEKAAIIDAVETALKIRMHGIKVKVAILPKGKDPNEVEPSVVRKAYRSAVEITPASATKLLLKYRLAKA